MPRVGGGILLAICLLLGGIIGIRLGQGSLGVLAGLVIGLMLAALVAWWDSRRPR